MTPSQQNTSSANAAAKPAVSDAELRIAATITLKLTELGAEARFLPPVSTGPLLSIYRFMPQGRTSVAKLEGFAQDIAVALGAESVLIKRMPGESAVGFFIPNAERKPVNWRDTIGIVMQRMAQSADAQGKGESAPKIPLNFGIDIFGTPFIEDLATLPHLLIAGTTGGGKSTLLSSIIGTIVYCMDESAIQLVLSDTKNVEFGHFVGAPHLLFEPATTVGVTLDKMDWLIQETERRLILIGGVGFRNVMDYNAAMRATLSESGVSKPALPYIVFIIDELADIMLNAGKLAEKKLQAIVQKSRAAGVHVIAGTQRPSVNVVAGSIKANFPARLTFRLPSEVDSRTVISTNGAEHLLMRGDMLYVSPNRPGLTRLHAPYAEISDIKAAVEAATLRSRSR